MNVVELQNFIRQNIPAAAALSFEVCESTPNRVVLLAPVAANCNHHHTVFGGSIAMLATLCGWALVHLNCSEYHGNIVIREGCTRYFKPAKSDLICVCKTADAQEWARLRKMLDRRGKGSIVLLCKLFSSSIEVAEFEGKYVVSAG